MTITLPYLRKERTRQFIPVVELAERSGLTKMTIWRLERGKPAQMSTVRKLARALDVRPEDLAVVTEDALMRDSPNRESMGLSVPPGDPEGGR